jgi:hypothetical protein
MVIHDAAAMIVQVPPLLRNDHAFWSARRATGEHQTVHIALVKRWQLPSEFAHSEVLHADAGEREDGVTSAVDAGDGPRRVRVVELESACRRVPNEDM